MCHILGPRNLVIVLCLLTASSRLTGESFSWYEAADGFFNDTGKWFVFGGLFPLVHNPNPTGRYPRAGDNVGFARGALLGGAGPAYKVTITGGEVDSFEAGPFTLPALTEPLTFDLTGTLKAGRVSLVTKIFLTGTGELAGAPNPDNYLSDVAVNGGTLRVDGGRIQELTLDHAKGFLGNVVISSGVLPNHPPSLELIGSTLETFGTVSFSDNVLVQKDSTWTHKGGKITGGRLDITGGSSFSTINEISLLGITLDGSFVNADVLRYQRGSLFSLKNASSLRASMVYLSGASLELFADEISGASTVDASYFELEQGWLRVSGNSKLRSDTVQMGTKGGATIVITGAGSEWDVLSIATKPNFKILDGGRASFDVGASSMNGRVDGNGSRLHFGYADGKGTLSVVGGGKATGGGYELEAGNGTVYQAGSSLSVNNWLILGNRGNVGFEIAEGGSVECGPAVLGQGDTGDATMNISGKNSLWRIYKGLEVGKDGVGKGRINISQGGKLQAGEGASKGESTIIGVGSSVSVSDAGSVFDTQGQSEVRVGTVTGPSGRASLSITGGASALVNRLVLGPSVVGEGFVSVNGQGSKLEAEGRIMMGSDDGAGKGTMEIRNGAEVDAASVEVGNSPSENTLLITGASPVSGSLLSVEDGVFVANKDRSKGTLTLASAGKIGFMGESPLRTIGVGVGEFSTGTLVVDGARSRIVAEDTRMTIGFMGTGALIVSGGGSVGVDRCLLGYSAQSFASALITGQADSVQRSTLAVYTSLDVGGESEPAPAILDVANSGEVTVGKTMRIGPKGVVRVSTGGITIGSSERTSPGSLLLVPGGKLTLENGAQLSGHVIDGGGIQIDRRIKTREFSSLRETSREREVALASPRSHPQATAPSLTTIDGGLTVETGGTLHVLLTAANDPAEPGTLKVNGPVRLSGRAIVEFTDGFAPAKGQKIELFRFPAGIIGNFTGIDVIGLAPGFQYEVKSDAAGTYTFTALSSAVATSPPRLSIERQQNEIIVSWPDTAVGYVLQSRSDPAAAWKTLPATTNHITLPANLPFEIFRLSKP